MSRAQQARTAERLLAVLRDPCALMPDGSCPVCRGEWRGRDACPHGWDDVRKANDAFALRALMGGQG